MNTFEPRNHPIIFTYPDRVTESSWSGHVPFGMFLVDILRPGLLVELGTYSGMSYCAFCQAVKVLRFGTKCRAIDSWMGDEHTGFFGCEVLTSLRSHHDPAYGSFSRLIRSTFDDALDRFEDGSIDLLHIDGLHTYDAVKNDFERWLPKMNGAGVILFHDIAERERGFEVWRLWEELTTQYRHLVFTHAHGLGLCVVGRPRSPELHHLLAMPPDEWATVQRFFAEIGRKLESTVALELETMSRATSNRLLTETASTQRVPTV